MLIAIPDHLVHEVERVARIRCIKCRGRTADDHRHFYWVSYHGAVLPAEVCCNCYFQLPRIGRIPAEEWGKEIRDKAHTVASWEKAALSPLTNTLRRAP